MQQDGVSITVWRRPLKGGATAPLVVLLHGSGADEHDLISLAGELPSTFAYAAPRGPIVAEGGYAWYASRANGNPVAHSLRASVSMLRAWLAAPGVAAQRSRIFLFGFSDGMTMAGALALDDPGYFAGAILLSGGLALQSGFPSEAGRLAGMPVFCAWGTYDTVLPAIVKENAQRYLHERSGASLTLRSYPRAHAISKREVADIAAWLRERT